MIRRVLFLTCFLASLLMSAAATAIPASAIDLPHCGEVPVTPNEALLAVAWPVKDADVAARAIELSSVYAGVAVCQQSWQELLPSGLPAASAPELERWYGWGVWGVAVVLALVLLGLISGRRTARFSLSGLLGFAVLAGGLGYGGTLAANLSGQGRQVFYADAFALQQEVEAMQWVEIAHMRDMDAHLMKAGLTPASVTFDAPAELSQVGASAGTGKADADAVVSKEATAQLQLRLGGNGLTEVLLPGGEWRALEWAATSTRDLAGREFKVRNPLNLRSGPGVENTRLRAALPQGTSVRAAGEVQGDWWQVDVPGLGLQGWVSSLWLRRPIELNQGERS